MTAGSFQVGDQTGRGEDVGKTSVGGASTAHRAGGYKRQPVSVSQSGQDLGESGVGGSTVQSELDGQADGSIPFHVATSFHVCCMGRGAGSDWAAAVGSGEELGEMTQAGVCRRQVPGSGAVGITQGPAQGAVDGTSEDEAGSGSPPGMAGGDGTEG